MRCFTVLVLSPLLLIANAAIAADAEPKASDLWDRLATADEGQATRAALALAARPEEAVSLLGRKLKAVKVDRAKVAAWIEQLGDEAFTRREEATRELAHLGKFVKAELEKAADSKDAEIKKRVATLLGRIPDDAKKAAKGAGLRGRNVQVMNINGQITITIDGKVVDLTPTVPPKPDLVALQTARGVAILEHLGTPEARKILTGLADGEGEANSTKAAKAALGRLEKR